MSTSPGPSASVTTKVSPGKDCALTGCGRGSLSVSRCAYATSASRISLHSSKRVCPVLSCTHRMTLLRACAKSCAADRRMEDAVALLSVADMSSAVVCATMLSMFARSNLT